MAGGTGGEEVEEEGLAHAPGTAHQTQAGPAGPALQVGQFGEQPVEFTPAATGITATVVVRLTHRWPGVLHHPFPGRKDRRLDVRTATTFHAAWGVTPRKGVAAPASCKDASPDGRPPLLDRRGLQSRLAGLHVHLEADRTCTVLGLDCVAVLLQLLRKLLEGQPGGGLAALLARLDELLEDVAKVGLVGIGGGARRRLPGRGLQEGVGDLGDDRRIRAEVALALGRPRFDPEAIERVRGQMLAAIAEAETDPGKLAGRRWFARTFPDHPYGRPVDATAESVRGLTRADLPAAHRQLLTRVNARIAVVGAIDAAAAGRLVDRVLADLPRGEPVPVERREVVPPPGIEVVELDVPQSVAIFGQRGLWRDDPDFFAAFVMNHILGGGGFESRLMQEVRVKRGLAYGVYSYLSIRDEAALLLGSVQSANARIAESLEVVRAEWARIAREGVSEEELEAAKKYLTGAFPLRFDSNAKIAGYLVFMQSAGLDPGYLERRNALIEAVTREDVARVARRLLEPDALSIVVVGRPEGLEAAAGGAGEAGTEAGADVGSGG